MNRPKNHLIDGSIYRPTDRPTKRNETPIDEDNNRMPKHMKQDRGDAQCRKSHISMKFEVFTEPLGVPSKTITMKYIQFAHPERQT